MAVKVDDQIDAIARLEGLGNDDADGAVLIMLGAEGFEAVRATRVRIRRVVKIAQHELAVIQRMPLPMRLSARACGGACADEDREENAKANHRVSVWGLGRASTKQL